jgi:hypothetical protein
VTFEIEKSIKSQVFKEFGFQTIEGKIFTINSKKVKKKSFKKIGFHTRQGELRYRFLKN